MSILGFALGVGILQWQPRLPEAATLWLLGAVLAGLTFLTLRRHGLWRLAGWCAVAALAGFCWAALQAQWRLAEQLPVALEGQDISLSGVITGLPQPFEEGVRFDFEVEQSAAPVPRRIALSWYARGRSQRDRPAAGTEDEKPSESSTPTVHAGERWQLVVRLKRPHGNLNPHGFDYEAWLFERGVRATGYVRDNPDNRRLDAFMPAASSLIEQLRERIRDRFLRVLPDHDYAGILVALAVGDQRAIPAEQWQRFSRTGITHLVSISGLHVTLVALLGAAAAAWLWRRQPARLLRLPAQKVAALAGGLFALAYCLLAGFGIPAQRTLYMLSVAAAALWLNRLGSGSRVLALALLLVLILDPWAVLAPGFWLSFGAVALLFYAAAGRIGREHGLRIWLRTQWAVTLGLIPALLALFQQFSLVSPLANAVAIPLVSFVITPLALIAAVIPVDALLHLDHALLALLMRFIEWLSALPFAVWQQAAAPPWAVALGVLGCAWLLMPRGFPARGNGLLLLLPLVLYAPPRPPPGALRLVVLDVGQGLAAHLQTANHDLLYDSGPMFSASADAGNRILVPYLRAVGVTRLDGLVISHEDSDHSGGAASLLEAVPARWLRSSLPEGHALRSALSHQSCVAGQSWQWDGVRFEILHPRPEDYSAPRRKTNDLSCVLKVSTAHGRVLLSGDIEMRAERELLARQAQNLRAEILLAPHHGSRTSSTAAFLDAVGARTVIFPVGYRNRFHHPNEAVWQRHAARSPRLARSDRDGAVTVELAVVPQLTFERQKRQRYWHGQ